MGSTIVLCWLQDSNSIDAKAMKGILLSRDDLDPKLKDPPSGLTFLREASEAGHHAAQYHLAVAYEQGTGEHVLHATS